MDQSLTLSMAYILFSRGVSAFPNVRSGEVGTLIKTLHMSTTCSCRCVLETCTPACDWVYSFKCISFSVWVHSTRVVYSHCVHSCFGCHTVVR
jgi:hypothetical protein